MKEYLYLEHDGKLLLVDNDGNGPKKPIMGRIHDGESVSYTHLTLATKRIV